MDNYGFNEIVFFSSIFVITGLVLYKCYRIVKHIVNFKSLRNEARSDREKKIVAIKKEDALAKFKKIHSQARDNRKKIAKEVTSNPKKTTEALRKMMKR